MRVVVCEGDCVAIFHSIHRVMKAEKVLQGQPLDIALIPVPRQLSAECGMAIRFSFTHRSAVVDALELVGLNIGEVIYGNVGALDRLDFTVMGPAVNRTARLESLTKTLGSSILFSRDFADQLDQPTRFLGDHQMKGIKETQSVFALERE
jgi:class 3 adenylate cyclase